MIFKTPAHKQEHTTMLPISPMTFKKHTNSQKMHFGKISSLCNLLLSFQHPALNGVATTCQGDKWVANLAARHRRRARSGEECIDKPVAKILDICRQRQQASMERQEVPRLLATPDGQRQALYLGNLSKWCPHGSTWTLDRDAPDSQS